MRTVDPAIDPHTGDARTTVFQLCELIGPATTYRYTDAPITMVWNGFTWANVFFLTSDFVIDADAELSCTLTFEDASKTIRNTAFSVDLNQFVVKVYEVWADASNALFGQDLILQGTCDGVRCDEDTANPTASIGVRGVFAASSQGMGPTQDYSRNCRYKQFKGPECQYTGPGTFCDRLYSTCAGFANTPNFGGFRFALDSGQTIQWQSTPIVVPARPRPPAGISPPPAADTPPPQPPPRQHVVRMR